MRPREATPSRPPRSGFAAQSLDAVLLQYTQELGLRIGVEVAYFIQKEARRWPVRNLPLRA